MGANQNLAEKKLVIKSKGYKNLSEIKRYDTIKSMKNLKSLVLAKNKITELDDLIVGEFARLKNIHDFLRELNLSYNKIQAIPESFLLLVNLSVLRLDHNEIKEIPENFADCMYNLSDVALDHNKIEEVPWNMNNLKQLTSITLNNNNISYLPPTFGELHLEDLSLHNNQLDAILFESNTIEGTLEAIRIQKIPKKYFEQVEKFIQNWDKTSKGKTEAERQFLYFLQSESHRKHFYAYLEKEFSHENLDFWSRVDKLKRRYNSMLEIKCPELLKEAEFIYKQFIEEGAPHSINIPADEGMTLRNLFTSKNYPEGINQWIFDNSYEAILKLMYSDPFSRYKITEEGEANFAKSTANWLALPVNIIKKSRGK
eukprot:TRINITY_DN2653_c0_g1_i1.p1 TRINITY_DN2653_c0_g1~~TRINITY_DN2653_c0_g1_i1.p1  ORF type:complete len:370 (+),score=96.46 TRINITY_DN2653_c0_g1_i1:33-1142(+)